MKQYEYKIETIPFDGPENWLSVLNRLGLEGWHCFDIKHGGTESVAVFARVIAE